jgi:anti-sigma factor RsiW
MHLREDDLELYVRGQLPADHTSDIKGHAAECSACSEKLAAMATFLRKMDDLAQRQADYSGARDRRCERPPAIPR